MQQEPAAHMHGICIPDRRPAAFFFTACYPLLCNLYVAKCSAKAAKSAEPLELFEQSTVKKLLQFIYIKDFKDTKAIPQLSRLL